MKLSSSVVLALALTLSVTAQQPNSTIASMVVGGVGAAPQVGPFTYQFLTQVNAAITLSSAPFVPFAIFNANPNFGGTLASPGLGTPFGFVDIGPLAFPPIEPVLDGISGAGTLLGALAQTGSTGSTTFTLTLGTAGQPCGAPATYLGNLQTLFATPLAPGGFQLSAACAIVFAPTPLPDSTPVSVSNCDDCANFVQFANCNTFTFYGATYTGVNITSNGYLTFGAQDTTYTETQAGFNSGPARIAIFWDDLYPVAASALQKQDDGAGLTVSWTNCPEFGTSNANTFSIRLDYATGSIIFTYGSVVAQDSVVGITRGGSAASPVTVFATGTANGDILSRLGSNPYTGAVNESLNQLYVPPTSIFNLANQVVNFLPNNPALTAYTMF